VVSGCHYKKTLTHKADIHLHVEQQPLDADKNPEGIDEFRRLGRGKMHSGASGNISGTSLFWAIEKKYSSFLK
jgi:hypothetical protein